MAKEFDENTVNVDTILQNLTNRPNVRSTLILSRKDGSIIKVSGAIAESPRDDQREGGGDTETSATEGQLKQDGERIQEEGLGSNATERTPAQILAESIYAFVASAAALATSLGKIELTGESIGGRIESGRGRDEKEDSAMARTAVQAEDDIQLLRLRLKKQEIIIFPDPNYLCCVVQDLEKSTR